MRKRKMVFPETGNLSLKTVSKNIANQRISP